MKISPSLTKTKISDKIEHDTTWQSQILTHPDFERNANDAADCNLLHPRVCSIQKPKHFISSGTQLEQLYLLCDTTESTCMNWGRFCWKQHLLGLRLIWSADSDNSHSYLKSSICQDAKIQRRFYKWVSVSEQSNKWQVSLLCIIFQIKFGSITAQCLG